MGTPRLVLGVLLALVAAAPFAWAAPSQGSLEATGSLHVPDATLARTDSLGLATFGALPTLTLQAQHFEIQRWGTNETDQATPVGPIAVSNNGNVKEDWTLDAGQLQLVPNGDGALVGLLVTGASTLNTSATQYDPVQGARLFREDAYGTSIDGQRSIDVRGAYLANPAHARADYVGDVVLMVRGPSVRIHASDGDHEYATGSRSTTTGTLTTTENTTLRLVAKFAQGTLAASAATWSAHAPTITATHAGFDQATGAITVGSTRYQAKSEPVSADGAITILLGALPESDAPRGNNAASIPAATFTAAMSGDVTRVNLRAVPVFVESTATTVGILALAGAAAATIAYYWPLVSFHAAALAAPLYTRLQKPDLLTNDVRNTIYEIIRTNPGISAREVHRRSDQSWGTVVYHLRQLERHHLVVSRALGRTRNYYENHGKYRGMEAQLACLQAPRSLALARVVLEHPGLTQEELATASAMPQPTTSYYVRKLKGANLVKETREGRYVRYFPEGDLARYVAMTDAHGAPVVATAPTGVQA